MIDIGAALGDGLHGRDKVFVVAIGNQAVREIMNPHMFITANAVVNQRAVDGNLAELVDQQRKAAGLPSF